MARASPPIRKSRRIETAVRRAAADKKLVLAVSGGRDSMALLHALARAAPRSVATVATFDHGTGPVATRAAELVAADATALGFPVVVGRAAVPGASEEAWRAARLGFLADVAAGSGGVVATAHTRDDQVETVLMRVLRDAGARGLAGLYAAGDTLRPLLDFSRAEVAEYAEAVGARWIEDPTNQSMGFLRNRVRRDLLPALQRMDSRIESQLLDLSRSAAAWRREVDALVAPLSRETPDGSSLCVAVREGDLARYSRAELTVLWPAIAARVGVTMNWRGTERAAAFTTTGRTGARIQLSGGWEITRTRDDFVLHRANVVAQPVERRLLAPGVRWDRWHFDSTRDADASSDQWVAQLPVDAALSVRRWQPGDRMRLDGDLRRVKRFLSDAHVSGARRGQWPVVLAGDEIVWIPGVRRSDAAAVRPGRPGVLYRCELDDR